MWFYHVLKWIPGYIGAAFRNIFLPYKKGKNVRILDGVQIDKPSKLSMGDRVSINRGCVINAGGGIVIGDDVLIGPNVVIYSQNHNYLDRTRPVASQGYTYKKTIIEDNVWIAAAAIILPGVTIGSGAVVAAGSVVTKDVAPNTLVVGNPARPIKVIGA
jgi:maltose O-acetyltransferase